MYNYTPVAALCTVSVIFIGTRAIVKSPEYILSDIVLCFAPVKKDAKVKPGARFYRRAPGGFFLLTAVLLRFHVAAINASHFDRCFHRIAPEGFAKLLIEDDFDEGGDAVLLCFHRFIESICQIIAG